MNSLFRACSTAICSRNGDFLVRTSLCRISALGWKTSPKNAGLRTVSLESVLTPLSVRYYSTRKRGTKSRVKTIDAKVVAEEDKDTFFVVRKGDIVGIYRTLTECQAQVGSSICDPPVSVYKGYSMTKDAEDYLLSCGVKNALYSFRAADLKDDLFGSLQLCPFQEPVPSGGETPGKGTAEVKSLETNLPPSGSSDETPGKPQELPKTKVKNSCIIEFDGASKGNPGLAGAGAVLRADDGSLICRVREGLGIATNNVAEYRALILGMKYALKKGFTDVRVSGDSKLVYMQIQGKWNVKNQNLSDLCAEAMKLKEEFLSFEIGHVLRNSNSEADAQANFAVRLSAGQVELIE